MSSTDNLKTLQVGETAYQTTLTRKFEKRKPYVKPDLKCVLCVIPGVIQKIYVHKGTKVARNERLLVLEAMKMQNDILSADEGVVKEIHVQVGQMVAKGQLLLEFE